MSKASRQFYSIIVSGPFSSGKTTFMKAVCSEIGGMMLQHGRIATVGQFALNEKLGIYLYETSHLHFDFQNIPGKLLGCIVVVKNSLPETFREAKGIIEFCRSSSNMPITVVANLHTYVKSEPWTQQDLRIALKIDDSIPLIECDVSDTEAVTSVLDTVGQRFLQDEPKAVLPQKAVLDEQNFLAAKPTHRFLTVVSTPAWYGAHEFMEMLSDHITWLKLDDRNVPCRWGYCDIDPSMNLHIIPVERFGSPKNIVAFAFQSLSAMTGEQPAPPLVEEHTLPYNDGTIGYIGLFSSYEKESVERAKYMVKAFGDNPYVLVNLVRRSIKEPAIHNSEADEASIGSRHPIIRVDSDDPLFPKQAMCLLTQQLSGVEAEKLGTKFGCL